MLLNNIIFFFTEILYSLTAKIYIITLSLLNINYNLLYLALVNQILSLFDTLYMGIFNTKSEEVIPLFLYIETPQNHNTFNNGQAVDIRTITPSIFEKISCNTEESVKTITNLTQVNYLTQLEMLLNSILDIRLEGWLNERSSISEAIYNKFSHAIPNSDKVNHLIKLMQWQYWWWFWFAFMWGYYDGFLKRIFNMRNYKSYLSIYSSVRPHGKFGDFIACIIPIGWVVNIHVHQDNLLKDLEWLNLYSSFTIRVRGKQWFWLYYYDFKTLVDLIFLPKNIGGDQSNGGIWRISGSGKSQNYSSFLMAQTTKNFDFMEISSVIDTQLKSKAFYNYEEKSEFMKFNWGSYSDYYDEYSGYLNEGTTSTTAEFINTSLKYPLSLSKTKSNLESLLQQRNLKSWINYSTLYLTYLSKTSKENTSYNNQLINPFQSRPLCADTLVSKIDSKYNINILREPLNYKSQIIPTIFLKEILQNNNKNRDLAYNLLLTGNLHLYQNALNWLTSYQKSLTKKYYSNNSHTITIDQINFSRTILANQSLERANYLNSLLNTNFHYLNIKNQNAANKTLAFIINSLAIPTFDKVNTINQQSGNNLYSQKSSSDTELNYITLSNIVPQLNLDNNGLRFNIKLNSHFNLNKPKPQDLKLHPYLRQHRVSRRFLSKWNSGPKNSEKSVLALPKNRKIVTKLNNKVNSSIITHFSRITLKPKIRYSKPTMIRPLSLLKQNELKVIPQQSLFKDVKLAMKLNWVNINQLSNNNLNTLGAFKMGKTRFISRAIKSTNTNSVAQVTLNSTGTSSKRSLEGLNRLLTSSRTVSHHPSAYSKRMLKLNKIFVLPSDVAIKVITNSYDVVHSWFIPSIGIKMDCVPGRATHQAMYLGTNGFFYGQCAEICGRYHHHMPIKLYGLNMNSFILWWAHKGVWRVLATQKHELKSEFQSKIKSSYLNIENSASLVSSKMPYSVNTQRDLEVSYNNADITDLTNKHKNLIQPINNIW